MELVLTVLLTGLLVGGIYALVVIPFSLVWGVLNVINLAHGAFIMLGAYVTFFAWQGGLDPFLTVPVAMVAMFILGWLVQRYIINLVLRAPLFATVVLTFGINMVMVGLAMRFFSADNRSVQAPAYVGGAISFHGVPIVPFQRLAVALVAIVLTAATWWFVAKTRTGMAIRATRFDLPAARLVGVRVDAIYALTFAIAAALAGGAGSLIAITFAVQPFMGDAYLLKSFVIATLGGLGSITGALIGAFTMGLIETVVITAVGATYTNLLGLALVLVILLVRPLGLLGKEFYEI